jgi:hypothetical protein
MTKLRGLIGGGSIRGGLGTMSGVGRIQGGVSTANLREVLSAKGLTTANLAAALANVPAASSPAAAPSTQPGQGSATPKADSGS